MKEILTALGVVALSCVGFVLLAVTVWAALNLLTSTDERMRREAFTRGCTAAGNELARCQKEAKKSFPIPGECP